MLKQWTREQQVLPQRHLENQTVKVSVFRNHGNRAPTVATIIRTCARANYAANGTAHTGHCFNQFALAIAVNARDSDDLARRDLEVDAVERPPSVALDHQILYFEYDCTQAERPAGADGLRRKLT